MALVRALASADVIVTPALAVVDLMVTDADVRSVVSRSANVIEPLSESMVGVVWLTPDEEGLVWVVVAVLLGPSFISAIP